MKKNILSSLMVSLTILIGFFIVSPSITNANSNLLLASVEWVQAQLNPLQTKVNQLETKIIKQEQEIKLIKEAMANLDSQPDKISTFPVTIYTTKASTTVHSGATRNYKVVAALPIGKALTATDSFSSTHGIWYRVNVTDSFSGWIYSSDITVTKPSNFTPETVVAKTATNIRRGASTQYKIVEVVLAGSSMKYLGSFKNSTTGETWYNVQTSKGNKGWVLRTQTEVK